MDLRWEILAGYGPLFAAGLWMTIQLTIVAIGVGLLLGVGFGLVSSSADAPVPRSTTLALGLRIARWATVGYVGFFRGTPLFVQILLVHFALMPALDPPGPPACCWPARRPATSARNTAPSSPAAWR
jgi:polar amino acid transport system permease protein